MLVILSSLQKMHENSGFYLSKISCNSGRGRNAYDFDHNSRLGSLAGMGSCTKLETIKRCSKDAHFLANSSQKKNFSAFEIRPWQNKRANLKANIAQKLSRICKITENFHPVRFGISGCENSNRIPPFLMSRSRLKIWIWICWREQFVKAFKSQICTLQ